MMDQIALKELRERLDLLEFEQDYITESERTTQYIDLFGQLLNLIIEDQDFMDKVPCVSDLFEKP